MPRNIVLCCDGTGNDFDDPNTDSNVVKLYQTLIINSDQLGYYHPGVGTMGAPNARSRIEKTWTMVKGLAFGSGLLDNVADAYRYLMDVYGDGDKIFVFGFSRGAYTARAIASLLHVFGLLCPGNEGLIPYILRLYANQTKAAKRAKPIFTAEENFKYTFSREVEVHFCGLWDTVSSYGWINSPIELPFAGQNPIIRIGRHAVSIHERRCCFQDNLWGPSLAGQDIRQVWFSGVHSDVGGSYEECSAALSKIALEWMLVEAEKAGLLINCDKADVVLGRIKPVPLAFMPDHVEPNDKALMHNSLQGAWWILEYFPRKALRDGRAAWSLPRGKWMRKIPEGSLVHQSVVTREKAHSLPDDCCIEPWHRYRRPGVINDAVA
jgi:uncharacterized protein (DUF2235 family)